MAQTRIGLTADPVDRNANDRTANDRQIHHRVAMAHSAAVLSGDDVQPQMQARFDAPVLAILSEYLLRAHLP